MSSSELLRLRVLLPSLHFHLQIFVFLESPDQSLIGFMYFPLIYSPLWVRSLLKIFEDSICGFMYYVVVVCTSLKFLSFSLWLLSFSLCILSINFFWRSSNDISPTRTLVWYPRIFLAWKLYWKAETENLFDLLRRCPCWSSTGKFWWGLSWRAGHHFWSGECHRHPGSSSLGLLRGTDIALTFLRHRSLIKLCYYIAETEGNNNTVITLILMWNQTRKNTLRSFQEYNAKMVYTMSSDKRQSIQISI